METVNVVVKEGPQVPQVITILEGEALKPAHPKCVKLEGNIESPLEFAKKRTSLIKDKENESYLEVDIPKNTISLMVDEKNPHDFYHIIGKLKFSDVIMNFSINSGKQLSRAELINLLKKNKFYFTDKDEYSKVLQSIEKLSLKIQKEIESQSDNKGNGSHLLKYTTNWGEGLTNQFKLNIPIFDGQPNLTFLVEIGLDPTDATVRFYMESIDLYELVEKEKDRIIGDTILWFEENTKLPIIFK